MKNSNIKLHIVRPPANERGTTGDEPTWNGVGDNPTAVTKKNYKHELARGLNWHSDVPDSKDRVKYIEEWIKIKRPLTAKKDLALWAKVSDKKVIGSIPSVARMQLQGFPLEDKYIDDIWTYITELTIKVPKESKELSKKQTISVQDRMKAQVTSILSDIDFLTDELLDGNDVSIVPIQTQLENPDFKAPHFGIIASYINIYLHEWSEAYDNWKDKTNQLVEGYAYVGKKKLNEAIGVLTNLESIISKQGTILKVNKIRKKKPLDKKKMVAKLKYKKEGSLIEPVALIGVSGVWMYDERKRKLCHFEAEVPDGIYVKGTTILGIKESFMKTLRKPNEQIPEFSKLTGKRAPKNFFDAINSKPQVMSGRTNLDMIILGVY